MASYAIGTWTCYVWPLHSGVYRQRRRTVGETCAAFRRPDIGRLVRVWCHSGRLAPLVLRMQWMSFLVDVSAMLTRLPACMLIWALWYHTTERKGVALVLVVGKIKQFNFRTAACTFGSTRDSIDTVRK
jgi:hypothetical protein